MLVKIGMKERQQPFHEAHSLCRTLLAEIPQESNRRHIIALAGMPGSGKSTVSNLLVETILNERPGLNPVVVPMDGFHLDNFVLDQRGLRDRKGSPQTFDAFGYVHALNRIREDRELVWVPLFDRKMDLSRASCVEVSRDNRLVITEGNYLLLAEDPWQKIKGLVNITVLIDVGLATIKNRLIQRWLDLGYTSQQARIKVVENDLENAHYIQENSLSPDYRLVNE